VCFEISEDGQYSTKNIKRIIGKPIKLPRQPAQDPYWIESLQPGNNPSPLTAYTRWSQLENVTPLLVANDQQTIEFSFFDHEIINTTLSRWKSMNVKDARNKNLSDLGKMIGLDEKTVANLKSQGISDTKSIGQLMEDVTIINRLRSLQTSGKKILTLKGKRKTGMMSIKSFVEQSDQAKIETGELLKSLSKALQEKLDESVSTIQKAMDAENVNNPKSD
jgi:hypothetical protein